MEPKRRYILAIIIKCISALLTYGVFQVSFSYTSGDAFLSYNTMIVAAAMTTVFSMSVMEGIWHDPHTALTSQITTILLLAVGIAFVLFDNATLILSTVVYCTTRLTERIYYNYGVSYGRPLRAMTIQLLMPAIELIGILICIAMGYQDEPLFRFLIVNSMNLFAHGIILSRTLTTRHLIPATGKAGRRSTRGLVTFCTMCVVGVTISDRWLAGKVGGSLIIQARFVYLLGLSSLLLTLFTPLLDLMRPSIFKKARDGELLRVFRRQSGPFRSHYLHWSMLMIAAITVTTQIQVPLTTMAGYANLATIFTFCVGFILYSIVMMTQVVFYALEEHRSLAFCWIMAVLSKLPFVAMAVIEASPSPWLAIGFLVPSTVFLTTAGSSLRRLTSACE